MVEKLERSWSGDGWQRYAHLLVQFRHGAHNVQRVPDHVQGDAGLEFFTTDNCLYQCYAPEETANVAKASSAMKQKATRDLGKLISNEKILRPLLAGLKFKRWFLLCPFLDDKAVVAHARGKGIEVGKRGLAYIDDDFQALVQCQEDFASEIEQIRQQSLGPQIAVIPVEADAIARRDAGDLAARLAKKLRQAYPKNKQDVLDEKRRAFIKSHIKRENMLEAMRVEHPVLWERAWSAIEAEEQRLTLIGGNGKTPLEHLNHSMDRIEEALAADLVSLPRAARVDISAGTLGDWLMRCPLNFEEDA